MIAIFERFCFFTARLLSFTYRGLVTEFTMLHLKCLEYMTQTLLIPIMMKMTIYLEALAVKIISSSLVKQQIVLKTSLDYRYIMGLN